MRSFGSYLKQGFFILRIQKVWFMISTHPSVQVKSTVACLLLRILHELITFQNHPILSNLSRPFMLALHCLWWFLRHKLFKVWETGGTKMPLNLFLFLAKLGLCLNSTANTLHPHEDGSSRSAWGVVVYVPLWSKIYLQPLCRQY